MPIKVFIDDREATLALFTEKSHLWQIIKPYGRKSLSHLAEVATRDDSPTVPWRG